MEASIRTTSNLFFITHVFFCSELGTIRHLSSSASGKQQYRTLWQVSLDIGSFKVLRLQFHTYTLGGQIVTKAYTTQRRCACISLTIYNEDCLLQSNHSPNSTFQKSSDCTSTHYLFFNSPSQPQIKHTQQPVLSSLPCTLLHSARLRLCATLDCLYRFLGCRTTGYRVWQ